MQQMITSQHPPWPNALHVGSTQDIPPWTRWLMIVGGLVGIVVVIVASLEGGQDHTIAVDKLLHFGGYATLAIIFVMGLRPRLFVPALALLALLGTGIEFLQPLNSRNFEVGDIVANLVGLAVGGAVGLTLRTLIRYLRTQQSMARARERLARYDAGAIIMREGASAGRFCVIKSGQVKLSRLIDGKPRELGTLGPGEVFGMVGALQGKPQYATAAAVTKTALYGMDIDELIASEGANVQPVTSVLRAMTAMLAQAADRMIAAEATAEGRAATSHAPANHAPFAPTPQSATDQGSST